MAIDGIPHQDEFWLFGYGQDHRGTPSSPGRVATLIDRAHWLTLTDHHAAAPSDRVWGVAYRIPPPRVAEVQSYLDIREINGYSIHWVPFRPADPALATIPRTLVYIGTPDNEQFVGPQDPQALAEHIWRSKGPSGLNREYLWELEAALEALSPESGDEHVADLAARVRLIQQREVQGQQEGNSLHQTAGEPEGDLGGKLNFFGQQESPQQEFRKVSSVDEQEETEKAQ